MRPLFASLAALAFTISPALADEDDIIRVQSDADVATTIDRLTGAIDNAGATVFATVDHGGGAQSVGSDIGDSQLVIFGNPKAGTPVIEANRLAGMMLPLQMLVYEDRDGTVWVAYEEIGERVGALEGIDDDNDILAPLQGALEKLSMAAASGG